MYLEDLSFCIKRAGWKVKKTHSHITFEPSHFNPIQDGGGGWQKAPPPPTSFSPVTSTNVGIVP